MSHSFKVDRLYLHSNDDCKVIDWRYMQQTVVTRNNVVMLFNYYLAIYQHEIVNEDFSPLRCEDDRNTILFLIQLP